MGMSRAALSRETGLDLAYLERIEADVVQAPSWFTVVLIADALGAELEEFRPGVKPPPKKGKATA
jgi:transcriptional regulator with XRE-family HTH domain